MRDVLYKDFDIDNNWFGAECEKFRIDIEELIVAKPLCHDIYTKISTRTLFKDLERKSYYRNLRLLDSNFCS
jgi:hypothetical protein